MIYKILSAILFVGCVVLSGFYVFERISYKNNQTELTNQIATLEQTIKESADLFSKKAIEVENLKVKNKELQDLLNERSEEIVAIGKIVLKWKNMYFEIKNAQQSVVDDNDNPVVIEQDCETCFVGKRFKVEFDNTQKFLRIWGKTFTNPPEAFINVEWIKDIKLSLILSRDKSKKFRIYLDTEKSDLQKVDLNLSFDATVFDVKWYERILLIGNVGLGDGLLVGISGNIQIFDNFVVGPRIDLGYNGENVDKYYGLNFGWFPFK